jgi:hypothetical protein
MPHSRELRRVERAAKDLSVARSEFERMIRAASEAGAPTRAIAPAAGLSHQRIWQILRGE